MEMISDILAMQERVKDTEERTEEKFSRQRMSRGDMGSTWSSHEDINKRNEARLTDSQAEEERREDWSSNLTWKDETRQQEEARGRRKSMDQNVLRKATDITSEVRYLRGRKF